MYSENILAMHGPKSTLRRNLCHFIQFGDFGCFVLRQIYGAHSDVREHWYDAVYSGR